MFSCTCLAVTWFLASQRRDELPLYLFDKQCLGWTNEASQHSLADDYKVPFFSTVDAGVTCERQQLLPQ